MKKVTEKEDRKRKGSWEELKRWLVMSLGG